MRTASVIINGIIFLATAVLTVRSFYKDGQWQFRRGLKAFRFFTVLSNCFCALTALLVIVAPGETSLFLKYLGTASVTVTLLTVFLFLAPTQGGLGSLLAGENLYMHLIGPVLAIVSYCFLEKKDLSFATALAGVIPVALYGVLYCYKVVYAPEEKRWEDFYGFNRGGKWPVAFAAMLAGTVGVCVLLWWL